MTNSIGNAVSEYSTTVPVPAAGGVVISTAKADQPITLGANTGTGLSLSDAELGRIAAKSFVTIGGATYGGDITVTGDVTTHPGYNTLYLQTQQLGRINATTGATLSVANLALQAGTGIGSTGAMAIDATQLAFASQSGAIQLNDANAVALRSVGTLTASSIPGDIFSSANVGGVFTLLTSGGGVSGQINYEGHALAERATLTLADGNHYQISYRGNGGQDVTLTRIANLTLPPGPPSPLPPSPLPPSPRPAPPSAGVSLVGRTLVVNGGAGDDVIKVMPHGRILRVYASFLPAGVKFLAFRRASVKDVFIRLGDGNDIAKVSPRLRLPVVIEGGEGDDELMAGGGSSLLIGGPGSDLLAAGRRGRRGSMLIGGSTAACGAAADPRSTEMSPTGRRPDGGSPALRDHQPGSRISCHGRRDPSISDPGLSSRRTVVSSSRLIANSRDAGILIIQLRCSSLCQAPALAGVVGTPSVVAEGLEPGEDFIDGHADDSTRNSEQANHDRRSRQVGCACCRGTAAMNVLIVAVTGVQPLPEPLGRPQSVLELVSAKQPNDVPTRR